MVANGQAPFCRKRFLGVITRKSQTVTAVSWNSIFNSLDKGRTNSKLISSRLYNKPLLFIYFHFLKVHALIVATLFIHFISSDIALFWISEFSCSSILIEYDFNEFVFEPNSLIRILWRVALARFFIHLKGGGVFVSHWVHWLCSVSHKRLNSIEMTHCTTACWSQSNDFNPADRSTPISLAQVVSLMLFCGERGVLICIDSWAK